MKTTHYLITLFFMLLLTGCEKSQQTNEHRVAKEPQPAKATEAAPSPQPESVAATVSPDLDREKRMAVEIEDALLDGEPVYLQDGEHEFLSIDTEPETEAKGGIIILHGRGFHPNWQNAIYPLRTGLAEQGWRTLSLQMPVLKKDAKYYDYVPVFPESHARIEAGIEYLKQQGVKKIILLAHSCGAHMAMDWIRAQATVPIAAYIGAGMGATDYKQPMAEPFPLEKLKVPVLDVYGADDYPSVQKMAPERLTMMKNAGNESSKQIIVPGADHYYTDKGDALVEIVSEWLGSL